MSQLKELEWNRMFTFDLPARQPAKVERECCDACKEAREIKCVCACGGKNHGVANRKGMESLDKALGIEKPHQGLDQFHGNYPLIGDLALDLDISGRLEAP